MTRELAAGLLVTPVIRLVRMLGEGGMGSVWVAEHLRLKTHVVVKFMSAELTRDVDAMARFEREALLAAQAKSPHVVQVFDHGVTDTGVPFIAMELLEGEDLGKRIQREGRIAPHVLADWVTQACRGLSRAHGKGIVHRDIKPENIFLCDNEGDVLVKILDFGIAKASSTALSATATGTFLGTPYFMSPEQTAGAKDIDARTDLWSLAVVIYFALTGRRPFESEALGPLLAAIMSGPIPAPSGYAPLPRSVDAWMARALARDRTQRFQSARELGEAFASAVRGNEAPFRDSQASRSSAEFVSYGSTAVLGAPPPTGPGQALQTGDASRGFPANTGAAAVSATLHGGVAQPNRGLVAVGFAVAAGVLVVAGLVVTRAGAIGRGVAASPAALSMPTPASPAPPATSALVAAQPDAPTPSIAPGALAVPSAELTARAHVGPGAAPRPKPSAQAAAVPAAKIASVASAPPASAAPTSAPSAAPVATSPSPAPAARPAPQKKSSLADMEMK